MLDDRAKLLLKALVERYISDGQPVGIAGLWDVWTEPGKPPLLSFTMLTMNATEHALLKNYHRAEDEKRIIVILPESQYADWLNAPAADNMDFIKHYPADKLVATPVPPKARSTRPAGSPSDRRAGCRKD